MPSFSAPQHADAPIRSETKLFAPVPRLATRSETSGAQLTDSGARKRSRHDSSPNPLFTPTHDPAGSAFGDESIAFSRFPDARSPPPLANDRYELSGGMERPEMSTRHNGDYDDYFQLEKQRGMWSTPMSTPSLLNHTSLSHPLPTVPNGAAPWMLNQLFNIVGGVAGKLVQFCSVPFRGFHAGGGEAYAFTAGGPVVQPARQDPFVETRAAPVQDLLPGEYPEDNFGVASIESVEEERPRMAKRLRTGENWVMVDKEGATDSRPSTPRLTERRVPNHARSPSQIPRPVSRAEPRTTTPKRPSLIPISRRSTLEGKSFQRIVKMPSEVHGSPRNYSRQSYGSPAMFKEEAKSRTSPLPPESHRLINKMRREELEDDARLRRMSSQMSAMLREAQEALGTKIEIEDEMDHDPSPEQPSWYGR